MARCPHCGCSVKHILGKERERPLYEHEDARVCGGAERPAEILGRDLDDIRAMACKPLPAECVSVVREAATVLLEQLRLLHAFSMDLAGHGIIWLSRGLEYERQWRREVGTEDLLRRHYDRIREVTKELADFAETLRGDAPSIDALREVAGSRWPRLRARVAPPAAAPGCLSLDELKELSDQGQRLVGTACPHCGKLIKSISHTIVGREHSFVYQHEDRRLCGPSLHRRLYLDDVELARIEREARRLKGPGEAARFARTWLGVLADEVEDCQADVEDEVDEVLDTFEQMCGAVDSLVVVEARWRRHRIAARETASRLKHTMQLLRVVRSECGLSAAQLRRARDLRKSLGSLLAPLYDPYDGKVVKVIFSDASTNAIRRGAAETPPTDATRVSARVASDGTPLGRDAQ